MSMPHICTVQHETSRTYLPYSEDTKNVCQRFVRCFRHWCMVWKQHPQFCHYYKSTTAYLEERKSHATSRSWYLIHPMSRLCFVFDMLLMLAYLFAFIYYPLAASFCDLREEHTLRHEIEKIFQTIFMMELFLRFFIGKKQPRLKKVMMDHRKVVKSYITSIYFIGDICGAIPVTYFLSLTDDIIILTTLAALRFLKILRLRTFVDYFKEMMKMLHMSPYKGVANFITVLAICFHWFACTYYGINRTRLYMYGEGNFSEVYDTQAKNISGSAYIETAFRTMGILLSSRRDVGMKRKIEHKILCFFFLLFGRIIMLILGVLLITQILRAAKLDTEYREVLGQLEEFMNRKKLPLATRNRLYAFYEYKFQGKFVKERKIENVLSDRLKKEINYHASNKLIKQVQIFEDIPTKILSDILCHLKSEVFLPNDIIINAGAPANCMYFISSGTVSVTTASGREVCHLHDGGYFGEAALVLNHKKSISNVTALEICETYRLDSKTFRNCFTSNPEIFHKLKEEAEKRENETTRLEKEFQEKLFLRTYLGEKRKGSRLSGEEIGSITSRQHNF